MGLFSKTSMDYVVQIIQIAQQTKKSVSKGNVDAAKRLLRLILKFDKKEFKIIQEETGSKELLDECKLIHSLAAEALDDLEKGDLDKTKEILDKIILLESNDVLVKVEKYQKIKKELKQRKFDIDNIADGLGFGIDKLIKPLVATLTYLGITTEQSCQGHSDHGEANPWVRIQANEQFDDLVRVVTEYDVSNPIKWKFLKFTNITKGFASTVSIIKPDRTELSKKEIDSIMAFCNKIIKEHKFELQCRNMQNYWVIVLAESGLHSEDVRKIHPLIKSLESKGYEVSMDIPQDTEEPDTYNLFAEGGSLKAMQQDIIHFSDFLMNNFKPPTR